MSFYIAFNILGIIISTVIFTIFAEQAGADHYFHFLLLQHSAIGKEKRDKEIDIIIDEVYNTLI